MALLTFKILSNRAIFEDDRFHHERLARVQTCFRIPAGIQVGAGIGACQTNRRRRRSCATVEMQICEIVSIKTVGNLVGDPCKGANKKTRQDNR